EPGIGVVEGEDLAEVVTGVGQGSGAVLAHPHAVAPTVATDDEAALDPEAHRLQSPTAGQLRERCSTQHPLPTSAADLQLADPTGLADGHYPQAADAAQVVTGGGERATDGGTVESHLPVAVWGAGLSVGPGQQIGSPRAPDLGGGGDDTAGVGVIVGARGGSLIADDD